MCLPGRTASLLIGNFPCKRAVTDHAKSLPELPTSNVEHNRIRERPAGLCMTIQQILDIILINQRPTQFSTECAGKRAFPTSCHTFHRDQPHTTMPPIFISSY